MFNKGLERRIKLLEKEVFFSKEKKQDRYSTDMFSRCFYTRLTLRELVRVLEEDLDRKAKLINMLLDKLGLEYVKITEENGNKLVRELLRKKSSKFGSADPLKRHRKGVVKFKRFKIK